MNSLQPSAFNLAPPPTLQWQPVQIANFNAIAGRSYPVNTTSAAITVTLPSSPSAGDQITLVDYAGTWNTNNVTINPNGLKIYGSTANQVLANQRGAASLVYVDATQGWLVDSGLAADLFTQPPLTVEYLVVGGGGSGASSYAGGGGAGGYRTSTSFAVSGSLTVTVGAGGAAKATGGTGNTGSDSVFSTITSAGGGGGGYSTPGAAGANGGSGGGGGGYYGGSTGLLGGSGNTPSTTPSQGNNGGGGYGNSVKSGGGGGGASAVGEKAPSTRGGNGGDGTANTITGVSVTYGGGGGGGADGGGGVVAAGSGGAGGGGAGGFATFPSSQNGTAGTDGLGGGGGGGSQGGASGKGGNGVVIIAYSNIYRNLASIGAGLTYTLDTTTRAGYKVYKFTAGTGTISW